MFRTFARFTSALVAALALLPTASWAKSDQCSVSRSLSVHEGRFGTGKKQFTLELPSSVEPLSRGQLLCIEAMTANESDKGGSISEHQFMCRPSGVLEYLPKGGLASDQCSAIVYNAKLQTASREGSSTVLSPLDQVKLIDRKLILYSSPMYNVKYLHSPLWKGHNFLYGEYRGDVAREGTLDIGPSGKPQHHKFNVRDVSFAVEKKADHHGNSIEHLRIFCRERAPCILYQEYSESAGRDDSARPIVDHRPMTELWIPMSSKRNAREMQALFRNYVKTSGGYYYVP